MAVLLELSANQPPGFVSASSVPAAMLNGSWQFTFTPQHASSTFDVWTYERLLSFSLGGGIYIGRAGGQTIFGVDFGPGEVYDQVATWAANTPVTIAFDLAIGEFTATGFLTGDGTYNSYPLGDPNTFPGGALYIGQTPSGEDLFAGSISSITDSSPTTAILGSGAGVVPTFVGASSGAGASIILDLSQTQHGTIPAASVPLAMRQGRWSFSFTMQKASADFGAFDYETLFDFGNIASIYVGRAGGLPLFGVEFSGTEFYDQVASWSAGQTLTLSFDLPTGQFTATGFTTGDGTYNSYPLGEPREFAQGALTVGSEPDGSLYFTGTLGNVLGESSVQTIVGSAAMQVAHPVVSASGQLVSWVGTSAATLDSFSASGAGTQVIPPPIIYGIGYMTMASLIGRARPPLYTGPLFYAPDDTTYTTQDGTIITDAGTPAVVTEELYNAIMRGNVLTYSTDDDDDAPPDPEVPVDPTPQLPTIVGDAVMVMTSFGASGAGTHQQTAVAGSAAASLTSFTAAAVGASGGTVIAGLVNNPTTGDNRTTIQNAINAAADGARLIIPAGTYRSSGSIDIPSNKPGVTVEGAGPGLTTILMTNNVNHSWRVFGNNHTLRGITIQTVGVSGRGDLDLDGHATICSQNTTGLLIEDCVFSGAKAAGAFFFNCTQYTVRRSRSQNSLADSWHNTGGSSYGTFEDCSALNGGDDMMAFVFYSGAQSGAPVHHMTVKRFAGASNTGGRGLAVINANNIYVEDLYIRNSWGAGIIIAHESYPGSNPHPDIHTVTITQSVSGGIQLKECNHAAAVDHGSILVVSDNNLARIQGVNITNANIVDTGKNRPSLPPRSVSAIVYGGATIQATINNCTFWGANPAQYGGNTDGNSLITRTGWLDRTGQYPSTYPFATV